MLKLAYLSACATGYILCVEETGMESFNYQFHSQGFLKMADDRTYSVHDVGLEFLYQSIAIAIATQ